MGCFRDAISGAREFMSGASKLDPWSRICVGNHANFIQGHVKSFEAHIARKKEETYQRFRTANQRLRSTACRIFLESAVPTVGLFSRASSIRLAQKGASSVGGVSSKTSSKRPAVQSSGVTGSSASATKCAKKKPKRQSSGASS